MKVEYDAERDLLYVWFAAPGTRAARTEVMNPGAHADFDSEGRLIGIELIEASDVLGPGLNIEFALKPAS